jgi:hypothetical protein
MAALANQTPLTTLVLAEHLNTGRDHPQWVRRDEAAQLIAALVPADSAQQIVRASLGGPCVAPENTALLDPVTTAQMLPATTNHMIRHAADAIGIPVRDELLAVIDTIIDTQSKAATAGTKRTPPESSTPYEAPQPDPVVIPRAAAGSSVPSAHRPHPRTP